MPALDATFCLLRSAAAVASSGTFREEESWRSIAMGLFSWAVLSDNDDWGVWAEVMTVCCARGHGTGNDALQWDLANTGLLQEASRPKRRKRKEKDPFHGIPVPRRVLLVHFMIRFIIE